jgi:fluoride exporter
MHIWVAVGAGGAIGAMARHALNHVIHQRALASAFPLGIFVINVSGSVVIGLLAGALASGRLALSLEAKTFLIVGVLGGYTTFSSFSLDTLALIRDGHHGQALWNVVGQVGLSLLGVWSGFRLAGG